MTDIPRQIKAQARRTILASAAGAVGPPGLEGPEGPAGPAGPTGPAGPAGPAGADALGWSYARLSTDFVTSSASSVVATGLAFTPAANKSYEFQAYLLCRTATATVGPRPGVNIPGGLVDMAYRVDQPSSKTATLFFHESSRNGLVAVGGLPDTTNSYLSIIEGVCILGASPTGTVQVTLASETAGTNVTFKAGSFIRWREIPA